MIAAVPLLIVPLVIYNMLVFLTPGIGWNDPLLSVALMSGATWSPTVGDAFILFALVILFFEIAKATSAASRSIVDHLLSTLVFLAALAEFFTVDKAATSVYAILLAIMLLDILAGYVVSVRIVRDPLRRAARKAARQEEASYAAKEEAERKEKAARDALASRETERTEPKIEPARTEPVPVSAPEVVGQDGPAPVKSET